MTTVSTYNIELRDKNGNLKKYLTPFVSKINWEWNRIGGCGACSITLNKPYRDIEFDAMDDIQIRIPGNGGIDSFTKLLIHFNGADAATTHTAETGQTVTFVGDAQLDISRKKFGTASLICDGTGDYVTVPDSADWTFGSNPFTLDFWWRPASVASDQSFYSHSQNSSNEIGMTYDQSAQTVVFYVFDNSGTPSISFNAPISPAIATWYHIALVRVNTDNAATAWRIFINGESKTLTLAQGAWNATLPDINGTVKIGNSVNGGEINGWIDEFRISTEARWTENFTPQINQYELPSKLVYRGFIATATPTLSNDQTITLQVRGYFDLLKKIVVQDVGDLKTYTTDQISVIVDNIADTFIIPNSPITLGTIDASDFECDEIQFLTTVDDALNTLSQLAGNVEYGVDENLVFFWRTESILISHKFFVGDNVKMLERKVTYDTLVNRTYLIGGEVLGVKYKRTAENTDSQAQYYLSEKIINNGSIVTQTVADQYLGSILQENAQPNLAIRAKIVNTDLRLEDNVPIGLIVFYDVDYDRSLLTDTQGDIVGEAGDGGSDITIGLTGDGGDDIIIGGQYSAQVDRIQYELSNTDARFNLTIQFGDTVLETAAIIKRLDMALASMQQY